MHFLMAWEGTTLVGVAPLIIDDLKFYGLAIRRLRFASSSVTMSNFLITRDDQKNVLFKLIQHIKYGSRQRQNHSRLHDGSGEHDPMIGKMLDEQCVPYLSKVTGRYVSTKNPMR